MELQGTYQIDVYIILMEVRNNPVNFGNRCYNDTSIKLQRKEI